MKKEIIFGNLLLLALMPLSYIFFYYTLEGTESRAFNAGITMIVFLVFYFLGKAINFRYMNFKKRENVNIFKLLVITCSLVIPLVLGYLYMNISINILSVLIASLIIIIGFDFKGLIDKAFEIQFYKEMEISREYMPLYIGLYVVLAISLLVLYPLLSS